MVNKEYELGSIVEMKKPHACKGNEFEIIRMGADIKIKCLTCQHIIMLPRSKFDKGLKKVLR